MSRRRDNRRNRRSRRRDGEDINPMDYISNLSDVMLILAVGIMLSLVIHWKVDLDTVKGSEQPVPESDSPQVMTTFTDEDLEDSESLPEDLEKLGSVYYDPETGRYYVASDESETSE